MCRMAAGIAVLAVAVVALPAGGAAAPPRREPAKGVVTAGRLMVCMPKALVFTLAEVWLGPLGKDAPAEQVVVDICNTRPARWQVSHGAFWLSATFSHNNIDDDAGEGLSRYELADLLRGKAVAGPGAEEDKVPPTPFAAATAGNLTRTVCGFMEFPWAVETDVLPTGPGSVLQFVLTNARGKAIPAGKTGALVGYRMLITPEERRTPHWSFTAHRYSSEWDGRDLKWEQGRRDRKSTR